jgi:hypothetical protein
LHDLDLDRRPCVLRGQPETLEREVGRPQWLHQLRCRQGRLQIAVDSASRLLPVQHPPDRATNDGGVQIAQLRIIKLQLNNAKPLLIPLDGLWTQFAETAINDELLNCFGQAGNIRDLAHFWVTPKAEGFLEK